jgi:hypothetical protein
MKKIGSNKIHVQSAFIYPESDIYSTSLVFIILFTERNQLFKGFRKKKRKITIFIYDGND